MTYYYEAKEINGILHIRYGPDEEFRLYGDVPIRMAQGYYSFDEERVIDGILCYRMQPWEEFTQYTLAGLSATVQTLRTANDIDRESIRELEHTVKRLTWQVMEGGGCPD